MSLLSYRLNSAVWASAIVILMSLATNVEAQSERKPGWCPAGKDIVGSLVEALSIKSLLFGRQAKT